MGTAIQTIGQALVLLLCVFAMVIIFYLFRGGLKSADKEAARTIGGRILDRTAWGMNGIFCLWIVLRHRRRLFKFVELSFAAPPQVGGGRSFTDTGEVVGLGEGMVVVSYLFDDDGRTLYVRRPFDFLAHDLLESIRFRRKDLRTT